jgi:ribosomal protein S18 acetylase RimI-like enzyme
MSRRDNYEVSHLMREIAEEREWFMDTGSLNSGVSRQDIQAAEIRAGVGFVAEQTADDSVIAFACIWPERPQYEGFGHVGRLSMGVAKPYRRQGIGRRLLEAVLAATKFERVELEVFEHNEAAIALYRQFGFETEGVKRNARFLDGKYMNIVLMARVNSQRI